MDRNKSQGEPNARAASEPARESESEDSRRPMDERDSGISWSEVARQVWLAGLGVMVTTGEEGSRLFRLLVERGRQAEPDLSESWSRVRDEVVHRVRDISRSARTAGSPPEADADEILRQRLDHLGIPTREEISELSHKIDDLILHLEQVLHSGEGGHGSSSTENR